MYRGVLFTEDNEAGSILKKKLQGHQIFLEVTDQKRDISYAVNQSDFHFLILPGYFNSGSSGSLLIESNCTLPVIFYGADEAFIQMEEYAQLKVPIILPDLKDVLSYLSCLLSLKKNAFKTSSSLAEASPSFIVKVKRRYRKVFTNDIRYVESVGNYCKLKLPGENILVRYALKDLLDDIDNPRLIRIHRKYAVNLNFLMHFNIPENSCMVDDVHLKIGRKYKKEFKKAMENKRQML